MSLSAGTRLGVYEVVGKLGEGGMGEVYRARDRRLDREVAIKILPDTLAQDPERLARFEREAKVLASFTHANIATLHALEIIDRQPILVMELVEGEDLRQRLGRGPIPLDEALPIAVSIAQALEAAHEKGIIHRDLKPANIKLRNDGVVKVLDFGLAKAIDPAGPSADSSNFPTLTSPAMTAKGLILGTAAYMSPEQARGRAVDKRADIWAFGAVLMEMLTGRRLFDGETVSDTLAAVLRAPIAWTTLPAGTPAEVTKLLHRCLERDPKNRLHDIGDARIVLEDVARGGAAAEADAPTGLTTPPPSSTPHRSGAALAIAAAAALAGLAIGHWLWTPAPAAASASTGVVRLSIPAPDDMTAVTETAVSPDGRLVAFVGAGAGARGIYLRRLDADAPQLIDRTEDATTPFFSPDSRWIGFRQNNHLEKIAIGGGEPLRIADVSSDSPGATWGPDGTIVFSPAWLGGLSEVSAEGGPVKTLTTPDTARGEKGHWFPQFLPDGKHVLFTIWKAATGLNDSDIAVLDVTTGKYRAIMRGAMASYVSPGYLVFYLAGVYQAVRFDLGSLTPSGNPVTVLTDDVGIDPAGNFYPMRVAANGTLLYVPGSSYPESTLNWISDGGRMDPLPFKARAFAEARLSPDGREIAAGVAEGGTFDVRLLHLDTHTDDTVDLAGADWNPVWAPDGRRIAVQTMRKGDFDTYVKDTASAGPATALIDAPSDDFPAAWIAPTTLLITQSDSDGHYRLKLFDITKKTVTRVLADGTQNAVASPDGRWIAFEEQFASTHQVYVQSIDGSVPQRITTTGGRTPMWSRTGHDLFYIRGDDIVAVAYHEEDGQLRVDPEREFAHLPTDRPAAIRDAAADGRLLVGLERTPPPPPQVRVVLNWQEELAQKVGR
jgi:eukaryotic-like serine/threonine-protein kinase